MNDFSGVNVTVPSLATVYVPTFSTVFVVFPSSNVAGVSLSIGTSGFPGVNSGVPFCSFPWISVDSAGFDVGITGVTVGVYLAETGVPFLSTRCTSIPVALPVNDFSGVKITTPFLTSYLPSPGTTTGIESPFSSTLGFPVLGSINSNAFVSSIGTIFCTPSTLTLPPKNCGNPFCGLP